MPELDDQQLLREFAETNSEIAFGTLVTRHLNLVYSTALRFGGNVHVAEEISQTVFIILARKAGSLGRNVVLSGWLYQTARLTAANVVRAEISRQRREQEAYMQSTLNEPDSSAAWEQIAPLLDDAMGRLGETERNAVVLRFFENKSGREVAAALQLTEAAAHKRVNRALDKLRKIFIKRGVKPTATAIGETISAHSVHAAPAALAKTMTAVAVAQGTACGGSTLTLIKGALKIMAWTKAKTAIVVGAAILLAGGTTFVTVKRTHDAGGVYSWQEFDPSRASLVLAKRSPRATTVPRLPEGVPTDDLGVSAGLILSNTAPQVTIVPTRFPKGGMVNGARTWSWLHRARNGEAIGMNCSAEDMIRYAEGDSDDYPLARTVVEGDARANGPGAPEAGYDFIANLPKGSKAALKAEVEQKLGLRGSIENRPTDVLVLRIKSADAREDLQGARVAGEGSSQLSASSTSNLASVIEVFVHVPVVDKTGLTNHFTLTLRWNEGDKPTGAEQLNRSLDKIGLELASGRESVEMLVVQKAK